MKTLLKIWTVSTLCQRQRRIRQKPRSTSDDWSLEKKQALIDSIIRGYDIPKIYLRPCHDLIEGFEVIDGQQRLNSIWEFCNNEFCLGDIPDLSGVEDISGKTFDALPDHLRDKIELYEIVVVFIENATNSEVEILLQRIGIL
jgi:hypothetical protein